MPALNTDLAKKAKDLFSTTLSVSIGNSDTSMTPNSVSGLSTVTAVVLTIDGVDSSGNETPNLREVVIGIVSGGSIVSMIRGVEGTQQAHSNGAVITEYFTARHWNDLIDLLMVGHGQLGTHKFTQVYDANGNLSFELATVASAVSRLKGNTAATGNNPSLQASGEANRGVDLLDSNGNRIFRSSPVAAAANYLDLINAIAGGHPKIASAGSDTNIDLLLAGKGTGGIKLQSKVIEYLDQSGNSISLDTFRSELRLRDYVQSGLNPTPPGSGLVLTIPSGVYYIAGKRYTYAGGTKTLTASKDCYIDIDTSGNITSVEVANGATTGMTLTANSVRIAKVVTGAANIGVINYDGYVSTGTKFPQHGYDPLGNSMRLTDPHSRVIGASQLTANSAAYSADTDVLVMTVMVPGTGDRWVRVHGIHAAAGSTNDTVHRSFLRDPGGSLDTIDHFFRFGAVGNKHSFPSLLTGGTGYQRKYAGNAQGGGNFTAQANYTVIYAELM